jgi:hypothetical protein
VNDAPALKQANVGTAMGITGTEVAKEAAKMILADDNFATIVTAVRVGRGVYDNLRKILIFALPTNFAQAFSIVAAIVIGIDSPLIPIQVLYVNLIASVTLGIVLALEPPEPDVMTRPPRRPSKPILGKYISFRTLYITILLVVAVLGNYAWEKSVNGGNVLKARGVAMTQIIVAQCIYAVSCRFLRRSTIVHPREWIASKWMILCIFVNIGLQFLLLYVPGLNNNIFKMEPIDAFAWGRCIGLSFAIYAIAELEKSVGYRYISPIIMPPLKALSARLSSMKHYVSWMVKLVPISSSGHGLPATSVAEPAASPVTEQGDLERKALIARQFSSKRLLARDDFGSTSIGSPRQLHVRHYVPQGHERLHTRAITARQRPSETQQMKASYRISGAT